MRGQGRTSRRTGLSDSGSAGVRRPRRRTLRLFAVLMGLLLPFLLALPSFATEERDGDGVTADCAAVQVGATSRENAAVRSAPSIVATGDSRLDEYGENFLSVLGDELCSVLFPDGSTDAASATDALSPGRILSLIVESVRESAGIGVFMTIVGAAVLAALSGAVSGGIASPELSSAVSRAVAALCTVAILPGISAEVDGISDTLRRGGDFFGGIIPVMSGVCASSGAAKTAAVTYSGAYFTVGFTTAVLSRILLPIAVGSIAVSALGGIAECEPITRAASAVRSFFTFGIGGVSAVILAFCSLQTTLAVSGDSAALRASRLAASGIPVVGSTLSGSLSTLSAGVGYLRSVIGSASTAALVLIFVPPLVRLFVFRAALGIGSAVPALPEPCRKMFTGVRAALDSLISVYVCSALLYIGQTVIFLKSGVTV